MAVFTASREQRRLTVAIVNDEVGFLTRRISVPGMKRRNCHPMNTKRRGERRGISKTEIFANGTVEL